MSTKNRVNVVPNKLSNRQKALRRSNHINNFKQRELAMDSLSPTAQNDSKPQDPQRPLQTYKGNKRNSPSFTLLLRMTLPKRTTVVQIHFPESPERIVSASQNKTLQWWLEPQDTLHWTRNATKNCLRCVNLGLSKPSRPATGSVVEDEALKSLTSADFLSCGPWKHTAWEVNDFKSRISLVANRSQPLWFSRINGTRLSKRRSLVVRCYSTHDLNHWGHSTRESLLSSTFWFYQLWSQTSWFHEPEFPMLLGEPA